MILPKGNFTNEYRASVSSRFDIGKKTAFLGIGVNTLLAVFKIISGFVFGAISIVGDGINNFFDGASSVVTMIGFKISQKPADSDHPYGHGRFEYIAALIVAVLILFSGYELVKVSFGKILENTKTFVSPVAMVILLVSVIVKLFLYIHYKKTAKKISSSALYAAAKDSIYDVITTSFVLVSLSMEKVFGWRLDGYGGLLVSVFILRGGAGIIKETVDALIGVAGSSKMRENIEKIVCKNQMILGIHDLLIHDYGPGNCFASVHVEIDHRESAMDCHEIIDKIERECLEDLNVHLVIHHDPIVTDDKETIRLQRLISHILKIYSENLSMHDLRIEKTDCEVKFIFDVDIPDSLSGEKSDISQFVNEKLKERNSCYVAYITYDPV